MLVYKTYRTQGDLKMRTINFIAENQKVAVILSSDSNLSERLADLEKSMPKRQFEGLEVEFDKD